MTDEYISDEDDTSDIPSAKALSHLIIRFLEAQEARDEEDLRTARLEGKVEVLRNLIKEEADPSLISKVTGLTEKDVIELAKEVRRCSNVDLHDSEIDD